MAYEITVYGVDEDFAGAFASTHPSSGAKRVGPRHTTGTPFVKLSDSDVSVSRIDGCLLHWRMVYFLSSACSRAPLMIYNCLYQNAPASLIRPQQCQMVLFVAPPADLSYACQKPVVLKNSLRYCFLFPISYLYYTTTQAICQGNIKP